MLKINKSTKNYNIIADDSVFTFEDEPLKVDIVDSDNSVNNLSFEFNFLTDEAKSNDIEFEIVKKESGVDDYLKIKIYNVTNFGTTKKPLQIAENESTHKKIFLSVAFNKYGDSYFCNYTFFEEK